MCHSVRTEDGARAHHDPAAPLASWSCRWERTRKSWSEVAIAADPTLALADVAALVDIVRTTLVDPVRRRSIPAVFEGGGDASRGEGLGVGGVDARGPGARGETGSAAGKGPAAGEEGPDGFPARAARGSTRTARFPVMGGGGFGPLGGFDGDPRFAPGRGPPELVNGCGVWRRARRVLSDRAGCWGRARSAGMAGDRGRAEWEPDLGPPPEDENSSAGNATCDSGTTTKKN